MEFSHIGFIFSEIKKYILEVKMKGKLLVFCIILVLLAAPFMTTLQAKPNKTTDGPKPGTDFRGEHFTLNIL
jgi:hypothetical protein